jgi:hypothetical protein
VQERVGVMAIKGVLESAAKSNRMPVGIVIEDGDKWAAKASNGQERTREQQD